VLGLPLGLMLGLALGPALGLVQEQKLGPGRLHMIAQVQLHLSTIKLNIARHAMLSEATLQCTTRQLSRSRLPAAQCA